ncbi:LSU ribosomal protein L21P [Paracoccus halophilus]|uniref:Large ribosomal subunit protein bL21 n=1 Tax=Paracoccus halophilus TaxID=376733 RepID=A0A099F7E7_9RHOB|nr:50S ribosomal protein L21 [Paracoccus halophilus]SFA45814.1 LSU ribosomal protein L21P [Paracoccus halophilus]
MFAVLKTGGKQYRVQPGDVLRVEKLNAEAGDKVQFNDVLMIGATVGAPLVAGAAVQAEVIDTIKADKVITYVKRRRKHSSQRTRGHRQQLTLVRITDLLEKGGDKTDVKAAVGARTRVETPAKPAKATKAAAEAAPEA